MSRRSIVSSFVFLAAIFSFAAIVPKDVSFVAPPWRGSATILFGGDMMFDRSIRTVMEEKGGDFIFSCIQAILRNADVVVANLEGPITDNPSKSVGTMPGGEGNYTFTFDPSIAPLLYDQNIRIVNIGNNHILNFGYAGLAETKEFLSTANVRFFGHPDSPPEERLARLEIGGIPFSFIGWSEWPAEDPQATLDVIRSESAGGRIVAVYTHWGDEYEPAPERVKNLARQFVDAGAAIVVGSHPHVVQEHEEYRGVPIYYSLGNMFFDQYWMESVRKGLLLEVTFDRHGVTQISELPIELHRDRRTCVIE